MNYNAFLASPEGLVLMTIVIAGAAAAAIFLFPSSGKKEKLVVLEREKPSTDEAGGKSKLFVAPVSIRKSNQNPEAKMPNGDKLTVDQDALKMADTLTITKKLTLPKGVYKLLGKEAGNFTTFAKSFADTSDLMLDNKDMTRIVNRRSLVALARGAGGAISENILYIVLALMAGVSVGWVIYPYFNHISPIIEYCTHLPNGTVVPAGCPG